MLASAEPQRSEYADGLLAPPRVVDRPRVDCLGIRVVTPFATLTYGNHSLRANKALLDWAAAQGLNLDRREIPAGDLFGCRYEAYRTDPRTESRKTKWEVEPAIRLADAAGWIFRRRYAAIARRIGGFGSRSKGLR